jgi:hypothetical protein
MFRNTFIEHKMCAVIFSTRIQVLTVLVGFLSHLNFLGRFSKNPQVSDLMKVCPVRAGLLFADGRTDVTKLSVAFRNATNGTNQAV